MLLLSACGWTPDGDGPYLPYETFVLWQTNAGVPPTILGAGHIKGNTSDFEATGTIFPSHCSPQKAFSLGGSYLTGIPHHDAVARGNNSASGITAHLAGVVHGGRADRSVLPLSGSMTIQDWCNGSLVANVEARPGPNYKRSWYLKSNRSSGRLSIGLTLNQTNPDGNGIAWMWGNIGFSKNLEKYNNCWVDADLTPRKLPSQQTESTFTTLKNHKMDVDMVMLTNLPASLNPDPPLELQTTIRIKGGHCDGQSFPVTLKPR
jgi:hypothetical protein